MLRILRSTLTVPASDAGTTFINSDITQADLEAAVPVGGSITPFALILDPEDADVKVKAVVVGNTKNEEGQISIIPGGDGISIAAVNKMVAPQAGGVDAPTLSVAHGARLKVKATNTVASIKTISILWKVENAGGIPGGERLPGLRPGESLGNMWDRMTLMGAGPYAQGVLPPSGGFVPRGAHGPKG